jgi:D-3-phosphoglycerate dehydrogenase
VIAYDPLIEQRIISEGGAEPVDLETLLKRSDIVSLHARITQDNVHMIGEKQLKMMKPSAYFINSARASLVDHKALYRALKEGWIAGAAIDVYDSEPIDPKDPLLGLTNITFTPHIAGSSKQVAINAAEGMAIEVGRFLRKQPLLNPFKSS